MEEKICEILIAAISRVSARLKIGWQKIAPNNSFDFFGHY